MREWIDLITEARSYELPLENLGELSVWQNPTRTELPQILSNTYGILRGVVYKEGVFVWDAFDSTHWDADEALERGLGVNIEFDGEKFVVAGSVAAITEETDWESGVIYEAENGLVLLAQGTPSPKLARIFGKLTVV